MLMIRLARFGAKKKPFYRVVVIEKETRARQPQPGSGWAITIRSPNRSRLKLDHDGIAHWTKNGAQLSETVARLVKSNPAAAQA